MGLQLLKCSLTGGHFQWPFSLLKLLEAFYCWPFQSHTIFKTSTLRHSRRARQCQVTMDWNGGLVAWHHHVHRAFSAHGTYTTKRFLKVWYDSIAKYILQMRLRYIFTQTAKKWVHPYFNHVANKWLIQTILTASRIKLIAQAFCCMPYFVTCSEFVVWSIFWTNGKLNWKRTNSVKRVFDERIWIIKYLQTHCHLSKFTKHDTSMINTWGIIDSVH